jgi:hypothetical protein
MPSEITTRRTPKIDRARREAPTGRLMDPEHLGARPSGGGADVVGANTRGPDGAKLVDGGKPAVLRLDAAKRQTPAKPPRDLERPVNVGESMVIAATNELETIRANYGAPAMLAEWLRLKEQLGVQMRKAIEAHAEAKVPAVASALADGAKLLAATEATTAALKTSERQRQELMKRVLLATPKLAPMAKELLSWAAGHEAAIIDAVKVEPDPATGSVGIQLQIRVNWPPQQVFNAYLRTTDPLFTAEAGQFTIEGTEIAGPAWKAFLSGEKLTR